MTDREELLAKQAKELADFDQEQKIKAWLTERGIIEPRFIHTGHPLYGMHGTLSFGDKYGHSAGLTWDDVAKLAEQLPALPLVWVKDGLCCSVKTRAFVDSLTEEKKERWESEQGIAPFVLDVDGFGTEFWWVADVAGEPTTIECNVKDFRIRPVARRVEFRGGFRYENKEIALPDELRQIERDGTPLADQEQHRFWSSSDQPGSWKIIWIPICDQTATPGDVARIMANLKK